MITQIIIDYNNGKQIPQSSTCSLMCDLSLKAHTCTCKKHDLTMVEVRFFFPLQNKPSAKMENSVENDDLLNSLHDKKLLFAKKFQGISLLSKVRAIEGHVRM